MSSPQGSPNVPRQRTVVGSCWPCKRRRVKCDLRKPTCRRCILSGATCNYSSLNVRWTINRSKPTKRPEVYCNPAPLALEAYTDERSLGCNEKRALSYFIDRLWPLFSTAGQQCPPPVSLALRFNPVLQAMCVFADSHRAVQEGSSSGRTLTHQRLSCLSSIRESLNAINTNRENLSPLLTAVLLLYLLDGFVDCAQQHAFTNLHYAGVLALIGELGGFQKIRASASKETSMLLSEFASTDLTSALLQGRRPYLPPDVWRTFELQPVWWESSPCAPASLATVFETMAEMSFYLHPIRGVTEISFERVVDFERKLQPTYLLFSHGSIMNNELEPTSNERMTTDMATYSFCRAFQHAALIYLYRAIARTPTRHAIIQQHVHACLECIESLSSLPNVQKCVLFPLYVAGAHAITDAHRSCVLQELDSIFQNLRFESVLCIRSSLRSLWESSSQPDTWSETFKNFSEITLVL